MTGNSKLPRRKPEAALYPGDAATIKVCSAVAKAAEAVAQKLHRQGVRSSRLDRFTSAARQMTASWEHEPDPEKALEKMLLLVIRGSRSGARADDEDTARVFARKFAKLKFRRTGDLMRPIFDSERMRKVAKQRVAKQTEHKIKFNKPNRDACIEWCKNWVKSRKVKVSKADAAQAYVEKHPSAIYSTVYQRWLCGVDLHATV